MTYACGRQFSKYMERFFPVLQMGLAQHQVRCGGWRWAGGVAGGDGASGAQPRGSSGQQ